MKNKIIGISILSTLCAISLVTSSCKEKFECSTSNNVPVPQIMKDYFYYKEGNWWVYKNVKNNAIDSMWVWQSSSNIYQGQGSEGFGKTDKCYEQTKSAIRNFSNPDLMSFRVSNIVTDDRERFRFIIFWTDTTTTVNKIFELFFTNSQLETIPPLHPIVISNIDSIILQDKKYHTLIAIDANNYIYDNIKYRLFAKNIGLIKYIDRDSNQWELIKYNVNQ
jgi:hypothetical protein